MCIRDRFSRSPSRRSHRSHRSSFSFSRFVSNARRFPTRRNSRLPVVSLAFPPLYSRALTLPPITSRAHTAHRVLRRRDRVPSRAIDPIESNPTSGASSTPIDVVVPLARFASPLAPASSLVRRFFALMTRKSRERTTCDGRRTGMNARARRASGRSPTGFGTTARRGGDETEATRRRRRGGVEKLWTRVERSREIGDGEFREGGGRGLGGRRRGGDVGVASRRADGGGERGGGGGGRRRDVGGG